MKILFLDTETNGKPLNYRSAINDIRNWPRATQISYQICDLETQEILKEVDRLIKPNGWTIPADRFFVDQGMSTERSLAEGVDIEGVLDEFILDLSECEIMVAHNVAFDYPVILCELIRANKKGINKTTVRKICTMNESVDFCQLPSPYGGFKWPKLTELHQILFGRDFEGAHNSMVDVDICRKCFFELEARLIIMI